MYRKGSVLLPILILLFIISLFAAAGLFYLYQNEYAQNIKLQGQIVELQNLQRDTASKLDESKKQATDLALKLQETKSRMDALTSELSVEKAAHAEASNKLEQLNMDLSKQKSLREDLENRLNQVQDDGRQIKEQIKIMQQQKVVLEEKIKNLESGSAGVELGKVVVNSEKNTKSTKTNKKVNTPEVKASKLIVQQPSGLDGKVMIVNKEFSFAVINLGSKDKVNVGDEFLVSRAGKPIGDLKVEKVHEAMSAAGFAVEFKDLIKENDKVTKKIK